MIRERAVPRRLRNKISSNPFSPPSDYDPADNSYLPDSRLRNRNQALFASFTFHPDKTFIKINIRITQRDQLGNTQAAAIQHLQHSPIALPFRQRKVYRIQDIIYLIDRQYFGQLQSDLGRFQQFCRVGCYILVE